MTVSGFSSKIKKTAMNKAANLQKFIVYIVLTLVFFSAKIEAQQMVDKTVATVSDSIRTELITYSDLLWQLAMQPGASLDPPNSDESEPCFAAAHQPASVRARSRAASAGGAEQR